MKKVLLCGVAVAFISGAGLLSLSFAEQDKGPEHIVLDRGMNHAYFPHHDHQSRLDCTSCHHGKDDAGKRIEYPDNASIVPQKCNTCHTKDGITLEGKPAPAIGISPAQRSGHGLCIGCHQEEQDATKKAQLIGCANCHTKP